MSPLIPPSLKPPAACCWVVKSHPVPAELQEPCAETAHAASRCQPPLNSSLVVQEQEEHDTSEESNHDPHYEPIVSLPELEVKSLEEDEEELFKM